MSEKIYTKEDVEAAMKIATDAKSVLLKEAINCLLAAQGMGPSEMTAATAQAEAALAI